MGAMQKVMQRLQAASAGNDDGAAPVADAAAATLERAPDAPAATAAFVADHPAVAPAVDGATGSDASVTWDSGELNGALVVLRERYSAVSEQYRSLRARLLNMNPDHLHQVLAVTSSLPQEGKSVTAINLGIALAEGNERRVVIADADFRRASISRLLPVRDRPGLAELMRGTATLDEVLQPTPLPNLKVIAAGATDDKQYEQLVGTSASQTVLGELRRRFDCTLLDTPPVNTVSDVCMLAPHCDGALLVIEMQRTPEPTVQEAVRSLQTTGVKILGCVLSRYSNPRGYYYDRYYSHYDPGD